MCEKKDNSNFLFHSGHGWCNLNIGGFTGRASYLTDVPFDFLDAFENYINYSSVPVIFCDEEGSEFRLVIEKLCIYIIIEREEEPKIMIIDIKRKDFITGILSDIEEQLDGLVNDFSYEDLDETTILQRKIDALTKIKYIKEHMEAF